MFVAFVFGLLHGKHNSQLAWLLIRKLALRLGVGTVFLQKAGNVIADRQLIHIGLAWSCAEPADGALVALRGALWCCKLGLGFRV